jgi:hypothetical protein
MQITGTLVEIGRLEDELGTEGIVIRRDDESLVTIKGMEIDEVRTLASHFMGRITITVAAA